MWNFQDSPMINESAIIILIGHIWVYREKKKILGEKEGITNLRGRSVVT